MEFRFWQIYSDATPYTTPTVVRIDAETVDDAVTTFCTRHRFKLLEPLKHSFIWVEDGHGATMQYSVGGG